jgi:hypothetical protein
MKTTFILIACLISFAAFANNDKKTLPVWTKEQSRTQGGGWIWFPGKAVSTKEHDADLIARGKALDYLMQECQALHRGIRFHERAVSRVDGKFHVYVRASIKQGDCKYASSLKADDRKHISSDTLKSLYFQYKLSLAKQKVDYSICNWGNGYCADRVSLEFQMRNDYVALLYAQYACEKGSPPACVMAKTTADFLMENY